MLATGRPLQDHARQPHREGCADGREADHVAIHPAGPEAARLERPIGYALIRVGRRRVLIDIAHADLAHGAADDAERA